ncbi:hypothetical protein ACFE04_017088 [Oxalis oulophora]
MSSSMSSPTIDPPEPNPDSNDVIKNHPDDHHQQQSPKTLTLDTTQIDEDPIGSDEDDDPDPITAVSPAPTAAVKRKLPKTRKKVNKNRKLVLQQKKWDKKVEVLLENFKPLPFVPSKCLDFTKHESLLKRLGLWEFAHMEFDKEVRTDLVAQLIASFSPKEKWSCVNGIRVKVSRADLARALHLPVKNVAKGGKEEVVVVEEENSGDGDGDDVEAKRFMEDFMSTYVLLHDDTWMMATEVMHCTNFVREGKFEKVDWAGFMWLMIERELKESYRGVETSYYASHMQCLIKFQKAQLFADEARAVTDVKEEDDDVKMDGGDSEDAVVEISEPKVDEEVRIEATNMKVDDLNIENSDATMEVDSLKIDNGDPKVEAEDVQLEIGMADIKDVEEQAGDMKIVPGCIELSLGGKNNSPDELLVEKSLKENAVAGDLGGKNNSPDELLVEKVLNENAVAGDLGGKNNSPDELLEEKSLKENAVAGDQSDTVMDFEENKEEEEEEGGPHRQWLFGQKSSLSDSFLQRCNLGNSGLPEFEGDDVDQQEENEENNEDSGFQISPKGDNLDGITSANLISSMEDDVQIPFCSTGLQIRDDLPGDFLAGNSSEFSNKRAIGHENNDLSHDTFNGNNKRVRTHNPWNENDASELLDQAQYLIGKAKNIVAAKDQALEDANMNQQNLLYEIHARDSMIEQLQKAKLEEQHKREMEVYRLDRELCTMGTLLESYRKALKESQRAFSEYREKCPLQHEPLYKDVPNSGGLVLSVMEIERQRVKQEDEDRINRLLFARMIKEFEDLWAGKFRVFLTEVDLLDIKLRSAENEVKLIKNSFPKNQKSDVPVPVTVPEPEPECTAP